MAKEFNLDDYQYTEEHINFSQWLQAYQPQPNEFIHDARLSGLLLEHEGDQWEHVMKTSAAYIWTVFEDDQGKLLIRNGYQVRGRIGYVIGKNMHNAHGTIFVDDLSQELLEHRILENH
jgi:hypothetical protein